MQESTKSFLIKDLLRDLVHNVESASGRLSDVFIFVSYQGKLKKNRFCFSVVKSYESDEKNILFRRNRRESFAKRTGKPKLKN